MVRSCITYCVVVLVVNLQFWLVCGQRFLDSKACLTFKADFFQLIFELMVKYRSYGDDILVRAIISSDGEIL